MLHCKRLDILDTGITLHHEIDIRYTSRVKIQLAASSLLYNAGPGRLLIKHPRARVPHRTVAR
ncbi:MAG: hypothetical protein AB7N91_09795 [Candidatus Tectimicrobiota bacterium]